MHKYIAKHILEERNSRLNAFIMNKFKCIIKAGNLQASAPTKFPYKILAVIINWPLEFLILSSPNECKNVNETSYTK